jgi:hypothetical protein
VLVKGGGHTSDRSYGAGAQVGHDGLPVSVAELEASRQGVVGEKCCADQAEGPHEGRENCRLWKVGNDSGLLWRSASRAGPGEVRARRRRRSGAC